MGASWISRKGRILQNGGGWGGEGVDLEKGGGGGGGGGGGCGGGGGGGGGVMQVWFWEVYFR